MMSDLRRYICECDSRRCKKRTDFMTHDEYLERASGGLVVVCMAGRRLVHRHRAPRNTVGRPRKPIIGT